MCRLEDLESKFIYWGGDCAAIFAAVIRNVLNLSTEDIANGEKIPTAMHDILYLLVPDAAAKTVEDVPLLFATLSVR